MLGPWVRVPAGSQSLRSEAFLLLFIFELIILKYVCQTRFFMSEYFKNKVVIVTGGTDGIGKALVDDLIVREAKVATCSRNHDKLYRLHSENASAHLHTMVCDVSVENDCRRFIESTIKAFGYIDIIINNAGI